MPSLFENADPHDNREFTAAELDELRQIAQNMKARPSRLDTGKFVDALNRGVMAAQNPDYFPTHPVARSGDTGD